MNREKLIEELGCRRVEGVDKDRLIRLIFDYFGDHDGELILQIALFFKRPGCYQWIGHAVAKRLEEETG